MYIVDDVCYADSPDAEMEITEALPLEGRMLLVTFSTGERRLFDASGLTGPAFAPLADEAVFRDITLFHGIITWMNGAIDIAPETVYADSLPYETDDIVKAQESA